MTSKLLFPALVIFFCSHVQAATVHLNDFIDDASRTHFNGFESAPSSGFQCDSLSSDCVYTEDGITVQQITGGSPGTKVILTNFQPAEGTRSWYPSGGGYGYSKISRSDGSEFSSIGLLTYSGWNTGPVELYYELLLGGASVLAGSTSGAGFLDKPAYLGFSGGGFDTLLLCAIMNSSGTTSSCLTTDTYQALAIDSIELTGTSALPLKSDLAGVSAVPVPAAIWLFGSAIAGLAAFGRRKKAS